MTQNLFEELQEKKQHLATLAKKAAEYGWISTERQNEILYKLKNEILTIGVIGQMKCGKSTFLNSFVFEDDILPAASTPMTAALSIITYGESKKIIAEFYTKDEWEEQKMVASQSLESVQGNVQEELRVKAAKELVVKASKLGADVNLYLGKTQEDEFANLIEYVGADGKYIAITKSATIYYPKDYLKGVEVVDTPGFNDPIVSREERTKTFLKKADVVLMMLYAGRPFDATDREILFQNVRQCGIGKVIIGINKYDLLYGNGETEDEIKKYVKDEIRKACKAYDDDSLVRILKQAEPIPLSAEMALLSELPMSKIINNEAYKLSWSRYCEKILDCGSQDEMRKKSHLDDLASAVKQMVEAEKGQILFSKPLNAIMAAGNMKKLEIDRLLCEKENLISDLEMPDDELREKKEKLTKVERKLSKEIESLSEVLKSKFQESINHPKLNDTVIGARNKMRKEINSWEASSCVDEICVKLDDILNDLMTGKLREDVKAICQTLKKKINCEIIDFLGDVEDRFIHNVPDFNSRTFIKGMESKIQINIDDSIFKLEDEPQKEKGLLVRMFSPKRPWKNTELINYRFSHQRNQAIFNEYVSSFCNNFDPRPFLASIIGDETKIIELVKNGLIVELIKPMKEQIDEILSMVGEKDMKLKKAKAEVEILKTRKSEIEKQLVEISF